VQTFAPPVDREELVAVVVPFGAQPGSTAQYKTPTGMVSIDTKSNPWGTA
jgi:hypothetical protein